MSNWDGVDINKLVKLQVAPAMPQQPMGQQPMGQQPMGQQPMGQPQPIPMPEGVSAEMPL